MSKLEQKRLRELDAKIAVKYFGWRWMKSRKDQLVRIVGPKPWVKWNWSETSFELATDKDERYEDWDRSCSLYHNNSCRRSLEYDGLPHYSTDAKAAHALLNVLVKRYTVHVKFYRPIRHAKMARTQQCIVDVPGYAHQVGKSFPETLCQAALELKND